jgi:hypothetical protein
MVDRRVPGDLNIDRISGARRSIELSETSNFAGIHYNRSDAILPFSTIESHNFCEFAAVETSAKTQRSKQYACCIDFHGVSRDKKREPFYVHVKAKFSGLHSQSLRREFDGYCDWHNLQDHCAEISRTNGLTAGNLSRVSEGIDGVFPASIARPELHGRVLRQRATESKSEHDYIAINAESCTRRSSRWRASDEFNSAPVRDATCVSGEENKSQTPRASAEVTHATTRRSNQTPGYAVRACARCSDRSATRRRNCRPSSLRKRLLQSVCATVD